MAEPTSGGRRPHAAPSGDDPRPRIRSPLIWFSGADPEVLAMTPGDRARYTGMGSAVLFTASLGGLSMYIAMRMTLGLPIAACVLIAIGWFLGIAGFDRWIVSSMDKPARTDDIDDWDAPAGGRSPYLFALPRLGLALLIGLVISTPLTLQIFASEIRAEINKIHQQEWDDYVRKQQTGTTGKRITELRAQQARLQEIVNSGGRSGDPAVSHPDVLAYDKQLTDLRQKLDVLAQKGACEQEGVNRGTDCRGTSGRAGCGARCEEYRRAAERIRSQIRSVERQRTALVERLRSQAADSVETRLAQARAELTKVDAELDRLQGAQTTLAAREKADNEANTGLLIRMEALDRATEGHGTLATTRLVLFLFFTAIECLPVIVKLLMGDGAYENLVRERKKQDEIRGRRELLARRRVDAQQYEDEVYYGERLRAFRRSAIDDLVVETGTLETDVARRRLHRWHRDQTGDLPHAPPPGTPSWP
ncbi:DUF4407 domain-containing protein, partial [Actinomadura sp. KC216]|uniref:DUF4407 domain-containing protein n=1 Tax=Actinomadura sp. KC216 TaxID=2530370 RepID=UPI001404B11A